MARDIHKGSTSLPPYFSIDPDAALADLDSPTSTAGFAEIAAACAQSPFFIDDGGGIPGRCDSETPLK